MPMATTFKSKDWTFELAQVVEGRVALVHAVDEFRCNTTLAIDEESIEVMSYQRAWAEADMRLGEDLLDAFSEREIRGVLLNLAVNFKMNFGVVPIPWLIDAVDEIL